MVQRTLHRPRTLCPFRNNGTVVLAQSRTVWKAGRSVGTGFRWAFRYHLERLPSAASSSPSLKRSELSWNTCRARRKRRQQGCSSCHASCAAAHAAWKSASVLHVAGVHFRSHLWPSSLHCGGKILVLCCSKPGKDCSRPWTWWRHPFLGKLFIVGAATAVRNHAQYEPWRGDTDHLLSTLARRRALLLHQHSVYAGILLNNGHHHHVLYCRRADGEGRRWKMRADKFSGTPSMTKIPRMQICLQYDLIFEKFPTNFQH